MRGVVDELLPIGLESLAVGHVPDRCREHCPRLRIERRQADVDGELAPVGPLTEELDSRTHGPDTRLGLIT